MDANESTALEDLGGRWSDLAERPTPPDPTEVQALPDDGDPMSTWRQGWGHRTRLVGGVTTCVICGEPAREFREAICPGPSGIAL